ncbi:MFS transporter [Haloechinothrix sp. LS1_15]|uniref:MFS transporter n=1 Tax=Haloechinothrix sp. LS1_15 TaxID=2652248 RepID=UPI00294B38F2|nr:MFS transporter [Haloechinothrix sp. LS1_15]
MPLSHVDSPAPRRYRPGRRAGCTGLAAARARLAAERVAAILALAALSAAANAASPLYPTYRAVLGTSDLVITALHTTYAVVAVVALLVLGPVADTLGRRPVLVASALTAAMGTACLTASSSLAWLFAGRALLGVALGTATGAGVAVLVERAAPGRAPRASLLATMAVLAGTGAGPLVTGVLADLGSSPLLVAYLPTLALLAVTVAAACVIDDAGAMSHGAPARWRPRVPEIPATVRRRFTVAAASGFAAWSVAGVFLALLPAVAAEVTGRIDHALSGGIVAALLLCSALALPLGYRLAAGVAQAFGLVTLSLGLVVLAASQLAVVPGETLRLGLLGIAAVLAGIGHGLAYWGAAADVDACAVRNRAGITSALYVLCYLGAGLPAIGVGALSLILPLSTAIVVFVLLLCFLAIPLIPVPALATGQRGHRS